MSDVDPGYRKREFSFLDAIMIDYILTVEGEDNTDLPGALSVDGMLEILFDELNHNPEYFGKQLGSTIEYLEEYTQRTIGRIQHDIRQEHEAAARYLVSKIATKDQAVPLVKLIDKKYL